MDKKLVLIAAASGRALAGSARRGGYLPLVLDWFGDSDTLAHAHAHARIEAGLAHGMTADALDAALAKVIGMGDPCGVVCGTGFEDRSELIAHLARRFRTLGNDADTVATLKDPQAFASLCGDCGIAHPETTHAYPEDTAGWLAKRIGGAGGSHINNNSSSSSKSAPGRGYYYQREVAGTPISALFLAHGGRAHVLGFSTQWTAPTPHYPFRYGGAVRPASIKAETQAALTHAVHRFAAATRLAGLNSADFLVDEHGFWLLEINTRPSATLDIFEPPGGSLFALHMSACDGALEPQAQVLSGAAATAIVYAERDTTIPPLDWPDWTADRPHAGTAVKTGEPLCTVLAFAATATEARQLVENRLATVLTWTHASSR
jgi:predicted ATP-grasp superfamily ATP-dependent carboligase